MAPPYPPGRLSARLPRPSCRRRLLLPAWFDIYGNYALYAAKHDSANFFVGLPLYFLFGAALYAGWRVMIVISATTIFALMSAKLVKDPIARKKADRVLRATEAIFTGKDVSRVK